MPVAEAPLTTVLKLLAEPIRLRIVALLDREELSVGELSDALGIGQSRVSNHLRQLREAGLLSERHSGATTHLRLSVGSDLASRMWATLKEEVAELPEHAADLVRLEGVLAARKGRGSDFFDRVAGRWDKIAGDFETGQARLRTAAHLLPADFVVADLGCGNGYMAAALLGQCSKLILVDRSPKMLDAAKARLAGRPRATALEFRRGDLDRLPIEDGEVDGVIAGMVFHHLPAFDRPLAEMCRVLKPGGTAAVLELAPHRESWMRDALNDRHLGLEPSDLLAALGRAGFVETVLDPVEDRYRPPRPDGDPASLPLYVVRGRKPRS